MFKKDFFKSFHFWAGVVVVYLNRNIFTHISLTDPFWFINLALFIWATYLIVTSVVGKKSQSSQES